MKPDNTGVKKDAPEAVSSPRKNSAPEKQLEQDIVLIKRSLHGKVGPLSTVDEELSVGTNQNTDYVVYGKGKLRDDRLQKYLSKLIERLISSAKSIWDEPDIGKYVWSITAVNDLEPNAFATPGGFIYANRGLLLLVDSEDELAAVLAHEIMHVLLRHTGLIADSILGKRNLRSSPSDESGADIYTMQLLAHSGYESDALKTFLQKSVKWERVSGSGSHPPAGQRLKSLAIEKELPQSDMPKKNGDADRSGFGTVEDFKRDRETERQIATLLPMSEKDSIRNDLVKHLDSLIAEKKTLNELALFRLHKAIVLVHFDRNLITGEPKLSNPKAVPEALAELEAAEKALDTALNPDTELEALVSLYKKNIVELAGK